MADDSIARYVDSKKSGGAKEPVDSLVSQMILV